MTSSGEVIALEGAGAGADPIIFKTNFKPKKHLKHRPYFMDPAIVPRVKQYLEENKDKVYVDIDDMVTALQRKYREYGKKKRMAFKSIVEKAFSVVLKNYSLNDDELQNALGSESSSDMEIESDDEVDLIVDTNNSSNDQIVNMYLQQQPQKSIRKHNNEGAKELIDISSDDEDQVPAKRSKQADTTSNSEPIVPLPQIPQSPKTTNGHATPKEVAVTRDVTITAVPPATVAPVVASTVPSVAPSVTPSVVPERPKRKRPVADGGASSTPSLNGDVSKRRKDFPVTRPCCSFKDVGGSTKVLQEVCKLLVHLQHPEIFEQIGVTPPRGFLLHGPPGCGKSLLANAIAGELQIPMLKVAAPEIVAGVSGESEERIRDLFDQAASIAPCVLFIDEIDAITPNRNNAQREMERRIVAQLLTTLDELSEKEGGNQVLVVGATNRPDSLDPALRRAGRFDREVCMGIPDQGARAHILRVVCGRLALAPEVSSDAGINELASLTPGFVGADLASLTREAAMVAVNRVFSQLEAKEKEGKEADIKEAKEKEADIQVQPQTIVPEGNDKIEGPSEILETESKVDNCDKDNSVVDQEAMDTSEVVQITTSTENIPEVAPESSDTVTLMEGDNETVLTGEAVVENNAIYEEVKIDEAVITEEQNENVEKETIVDGDKAGESIIPPQTDAPLLSTEVVDITPENSNKLQNVSQKPHDDIEVMEVAVASGGDETPKPSVNQSDEVKEKELALSQKLQPLSIWSPELCQLMAWLHNSPLTAAQLGDLTITMSDFHEALHHVQPSAKREGFATVPDVTWEDVGSLANVRAELQLCVLAPVRYAEQYSQLGLNAPTGVLLCGPPGCGKTLLAKAVANEAGINFISVKGPELLNMYVGESERAVRQVFQRARNSAPCVIFFDELDALCPRRSDSGDNGVSSRVVNQLLTEMDGVEGRSAVYLMAASNRPDIIDPAVLRPGRLDKIIYVGLPNAEDRKDILRALTKNGTKPLLASDVNLSEIASRVELEGYSGADLAALVKEAGVHALREFIATGENPQAGPLSVAIKHFNSAAAKIRPSVTGKALKHYEKLKEMYGTPSPEEKPKPTETS
ncbi:nuclear valosin-containing protein-like [Thrips palmi]|uniref:Nuclear valosin-containing protein-like n=1 Tax=Thrips palmi TaxID=161013 RepID=A0A6P9A9L4_THRPL|nr:nuclear valosin-containing protein-like [Thrips palmi]